MERNAGMLMESWTRESIAGVTPLYSNTRWIGQPTTRLGCPGTLWKKTSQTTSLNSMKNTQTVQVRTALPAMSQVVVEIRTNPDNEVAGAPPRGGATVTVRLECLRLQCRYSGNAPHTTYKHRSDEHTCFPFLVFRLVII